MAEKNHRGMVSKAVLLIALVAVGALTAASASGAAKGPTTETIQIKQKPNGKPIFKDTGDGIVLPGDTLEVVNTTDPDAIGPHTFSLVKPKSIPETKQKIKDCEHLKPKTICRAIVKWHEITFNPFNVGQPDAEAGAAGWDTEGSKKNKGDSWFTQTQNETTSRLVSASPGTIHFICAVHPFMHGSLEVKGP